MGTAQEDKLGDAGQGQALPAPMVADVPQGQWLVTVPVSTLSSVCRWGPEAGETIKIAKHAGVEARRARCTWAPPCNVFLLGTARDSPELTLAERGYVAPVT